MEIADKVAASPGVASELNSKKASKPCVCWLF
jgi:hypothetical protein